MTLIRVRAPASTANLGPGFDCLALALDLWNEATFELEGEGVVVEVQGLGAETLPGNQENQVARAALAAFAAVGEPPPRGLRVRCENRIPLGAGLGSSAAAALCGLLGANALLGHRLTQEQLLSLVVEMEGHPDNAAAALLGGLVICATLGTGPLVKHLNVPGRDLAFAVPVFSLPTVVARQALPAQVTFQDAVYNLSRTSLVVEALRSEELDLLCQVMDDRLHQPYRFPLIPGAEAATRAARQAGAAAVALSGAGPSLVAFCEANHKQVAQAMAAAFASAGLAAQAMVLGISPFGAEEF